MSTAKHIRTRERAYHIWVRQGCPDGLETEHWLQAERELALEAEAAATEAKSGATAAPAEPSATKPRPKKATASAGTKKAKASAGTKKAKASAGAKKSPKGKAKQD